MSILRRFVRLVSWPYRAIVHGFNVAAFAWAITGGWRR